MGKQPFEIRGHVERELPENFDPDKLHAFIERLITDEGFLAKQFVEYMRYEVTRKSRKAARKR